MAGEELLLLGTETVFSAVGAGAQRVLEEKYQERENWGYREQLHHWG